MRQLCSRSCTFARRATTRLLGAEMFCAYDRSVVLLSDDEQPDWQPALAPSAYDRPNIWALKLRALAARGALDEAHRGLSLVSAARLACLPCDREYLGTLGALVRVALRVGAVDYARVLHALLEPYGEHFAVNPSFFCEGSVSQLLGMLAQSFG